MANGHNADRADPTPRGTDLAPAPAALLVLLTVGVADTAVMVAAARSLISGPQTILLHLGIVALAAALLGRRAVSGDDGGVILLGLLTILATGPFGAFGALVLTWLVRRNAGTEARLAGWYERIALSASQDDFTTLSDRVAIGRSANLAAPPPSLFLDLFRNGPIAEQQSALGLIARAFHPGYLPALKIALESTEPVIRVQAAAVAARVRSPLQAYITGQIRCAANPSISAAEAIEICDQLDSAITSGLLEEGGRVEAISVHEALLARTFARADAVARNAAARIPQTSKRGSAEAADAYAAHLLAEGRLADFRAARLKIRRPLFGRYCHRVVHARPAGSRVRLALRPIAVRVRQ